VSGSWFRSQFIWEPEEPETEEEVDEFIGNLFREDFPFGEESYTDILEFYYIPNDNDVMSTMRWRCLDYEDNDGWSEVTYNSSSIFALNMCALDDELDDEGRSDVSSEKD